MAVNTCLNHLRQIKRQPVEPLLSYYPFRKRLSRINQPVYYLLLSGAFALYFIEILGLTTATKRLIALMLYVAWTLFADLCWGSVVYAGKEIGSRVL